MRLQFLKVALAVAAIAVPAFDQAASAEPLPGWRAEWPVTDFSRSEVAFDEILSGGPPRDGIPSIDVPRFAPVSDAAKALAPSEPALTLEIGGEARAYPLRILIWHEIVNDTVGGRPVVVTFCPLCNSGAVFERNVAGEPTTFGTTGKLRHSDLVMYDRATESWWQQFEGRAIVGARAGEELERIPARLESIAEFQARHPGGQILLPPQDMSREYGRNPYAGYDSAPTPFLFRGEYDGPGSPLMRVVSIEGVDQAWSLDLLRNKREIRTGDLVIRWQPGQNSALDAAEITEGRDVGTVTVQRESADGTLQDVAYDVPFAFAFRAFRPEAPIHHLE